MRTQRKLALVHLVVDLYLSLLVVLINYAPLSLSALTYLSNEQSARSLLYALTKGLPILEKTNVLQVFRSICAVSVWIAILKLALILKIRR